MLAKGGEMPRRFQFKCLFWSEDVQFERIALVVQKQLFEIGIDVEMVPMTLRDLKERVGTGDFETILIPMVSGRSLEWTVSVLALGSSGREQSFARVTRQPTLRSIGCAQLNPMTRLAWRSRTFNA